MNIRKIIREEADDMSWIKGVSDQIPRMNDRLKVDPREIFESYLKTDDQYVAETKEYFEGEGWLEYDDNGWEWIESPNLTDWEVREMMEGIDTPEWEYHDSVTVEYELEYSSSTELTLFKRKKDGKFFGFTFQYYYHDGPDDAQDVLYERFPREVTETVWR